MVDQVLGGAKFYFALAYMDDVVISRLFQEPIIRLDIVLRCIQAADLAANPQKMQLTIMHINLLGFLLKSGTVRPNKAENYPRVSVPVQCEELASVPRRG